MLQFKRQLNHGKNLKIIQIKCENWAQSPNSLAQLASYNITSRGFMASPSFEASTRYEGQKAQSLENSCHSAAFAATWYTRTT